VLRQTRELEAKRGEPTDPGGAARSQSAAGPARPLTASARLRLRLRLRLRRRLPTSHVATGIEFCFNYRIRRVRGYSITSSSRNSSYTLLSSRAHRFREFDADCCVSF